MSRSHKERFLLFNTLLIMNNEVSEVKLTYKSKVKASANKETKRIVK